MNHGNRMVLNKENGGAVSKFNECINALLPGECDDWLISKFIAKPIEGRRKPTTLTPSDFEKADEICSKCANFKKRDTSQISS